MVSVYATVTVVSDADCSVIVVTSVDTHVSKVKRSGEWIELRLNVNELSSEQLDSS